MKSIEFDNDHMIRKGYFHNGIKFVSKGDGDKTILFFMGGPGNIIFDEITPFNLYSRLIENNCTIYLVTRKSNLPDDYSVQNMATDYAHIIEQEFNGKVHAVIGVSYGGLITQYLAHMFPDVSDNFILLGAAYRVPDEGSMLDYNYATMMSEGNYQSALQLIFSGDVYYDSKKNAELRSIVAVSNNPLIETFQNIKSDTFEKDILIEAKAEINFNAEAICMEINVPFLIIGGENDHYFPIDIIRKTADLIPQSELILLEKTGHLDLLSGDAVHIICDYLLR